MTAQRANAPPQLLSWEAPELRGALATATIQAARAARRQHLHRADRDDLRQDILVALLERREQFDPARGAWSTFAGVVARTVVADQMRARQRQRVTCLPLDLDLFPTGASVTQQDCADADLTLDLRRVAAELPLQPAALLRLLATLGDVAAAQRTDARSCTAFYRAVADLRCWLRALGMRPAAPGERRQPPPTRWEKSPLVSVEKEIPNHA
ncbi:sigma factor [Roseomonas sp. CAU 1739]|uniref:RNA polymerase sigma factor n=1 Tax=Roseomonas sp. CAU 1739 TaxID=3140364 RepID=UPI00325B237A